MTSDFQNETQNYATVSHDFTALAAQLFCVTQIEEKLMRQHSDLLTAKQIDELEVHVSHKVQETIESLGGAITDNLDSSANSATLLHQFKRTQLLKELDYGA